MPVIYTGMQQLHPDFIAWRYAFFIPGYLHILTGIGILFFAEDLPDGNYALLKKKGNMSQDSGLKQFIAGVSNYRCASAVLSSPALDQLR